MFPPWPQFRSFFGGPWTSIVWAVQSSQPAMRRRRPLICLCSATTSCVWFQWLFQIMKWRAIFWKGMLLSRSQRTSILLGWWLNHQDIGMECAQNFLRSLASNWPIVMENLGHLSRCLTWAAEQVCLGLELASCRGSRLNLGRRFDGLIGFIAYCPLRKWRLRPGERIWPERLKVKPLSETSVKPLNVDSRPFTWKSAGLHPVVS